MQSNKFNNSLLNEISTKYGLDAPGQKAYFV